LGRNQSKIYNTSKQVEQALAKSKDLDDFIALISPATT
jgi:hypothetical protein